MRKKIICFILTLTIVMLTACGNKIDCGNNIDEQTQNNYIQDWGNDFYILIDKETGVNYIVFRQPDKYGITARLDSNGKPIVSEVNND